MDSGPAALELRADVSLPELFVTFFKVGLLSFGGGLSGWIYQEVVVRRRWITTDDFLAGLTISQILPGANVTNMAVYVGNRVRGAAGASIAVAALLLGPFVVVIAIAQAFSWLNHFEGINDFLDGVAAAAVGLLLVIGLQAGRAALTSIPSACALAAIFVGIGFIGTPLVTTVLVVGVLSVALSWQGGGHGR